MNNNINIEKTRLQIQMLILSMATAFSLYGCSDSGSGNGQQSKSAASATASNASPEPAKTETVTAGPAMPETPAQEAPMPETSMPETSMPETQAMETQTQETTSMAAESGATAVSGGEQVAAATESAEAPQANGRQIYYTYCAICHKQGMNAAPKYGNKALWIKRIEQGRETMYKHAIEGLRGMPPRGGFSSLTDEEVKAGVDYMVKGSGGWGDS
ncbi:MAG TPA: c-type cytochrome [Gammaproteobacteria bacterium]|nr:c-type cytochrome [Gammaproteobacteria bacterium]